MQLCYVDESGGTDVFDPQDDSSSPCMVIASVFVPQQNLASLGLAFLRLKKAFNPSISNAKFAELVAFEVKGAKLREDVREGSRRRTRRTFRLLDELFEVMRANGCRLSASVYVKQPGLKPRTDRNLYRTSIGWIADCFHDYLVTTGEQGLMVLDSRSPVKNSTSAMWILSGRYKKGGDSLKNFIECPLYGHSDSNITLQIADLVASAVIYPAVCRTFHQDSGSIGTAARGGDI